MMNWTARYVAQVKSYLPAGNRDDVAEEISSLLTEKVADREEELQRDLDEQETFALLKEFGHPLKVASAYRNNGVLISEALFPIYMLTLRYLVVVLVAVFAVSMMAFYITGNYDAWPGFGIGDLFDMGMFYFGAITLGFHITDRILQKQDFLANWQPRDLPREDCERESLFVTVFTIIVILIWFRILSSVPVDHTLDVLLGSSGNRLSTFVLWLKLQAVLCLPAYVWLLVRPYWSIGKRTLIIVSDLLVLGGIVICLSIDSATFASRLAELLPSFENSGEVASASTIILSIWLLGIAWDMVNHSIKIWRELA